MRTFKCWGSAFSGNVLYEYFYDRKIADKKGNVIDTKKYLQRVGLQTEDNKIIHLTVPEEV